MEKIVEQSLLFDFYGELLTEHQQKVYEDAVLNDMSLSEVADNYGISRQGVHDLLKRCDKAMQDYEERLHLYSKFSTLRDKLSEVEKTAGTMDEESLQKDRQRILRLVAEMLEEL